MRCLYCGELCVDFRKGITVYCDSKTPEGIKELVICSNCWRNNVKTVKGIEFHRWCKTRVDALQDDGTIADYYVENE